MKCRVAHERVQYHGDDGKLITESLGLHAQEHRKATPRFPRRLPRVWNRADRKQAILEELANRGSLLRGTRRGGRARSRRLRPRLPRRLRPARPHPPRAGGEGEEARLFSQYGEKARAVLDALLDKYADGGVQEIEDSPSPEGRAPLTAIGTPWKSSVSSAAGSYLARRPRTRNATLHKVANA